MEAIGLLILLVSPVFAKTTLTTLNQHDLSDGAEEIFASLRSEATTTDYDGNDLNTVGGNSLILAKKSQAISTIYSPGNKATEKYESEGKIKLTPIRRENLIEKLKPESLVWDNCLETTFRENQRKVIKAQDDMEHVDHDVQIDIETNKKIGLLWNKRDVINENRTAAMKAWLDKYNTLKNIKTEERRQPKPEIVTKKTAISTTEITTKPVTKEISFKITEIVTSAAKNTENPNLSTEHEKDIRARFTEDWFEVDDVSKIRFGSLPQARSYLIPKLKLDEGFYPFSFMSQFFSLIQPFEFPVGLIKDVVTGEFTFPYSFLQSINVESTFLIFIIIFSCLAFVIPAYLIILVLLNLLHKSRCDDELETGALFPETEESDCNNRALVVGTVFIVLLCCLLISGMAVSNEQARSAAEESRNVINCACADIASWLSASARELYHSLAPPIDMVLQAYRDDLKNIEPLLGEPIRQAIASESGIDLVLDSLADIVSESEELTTKITSLRDVSIKAGTLSLATSDRIRDLARQLELIKKNCITKDAPLCDTLNTNALEVKMKFDMILHEKQLLDLRSLGVENLTRAISVARQEFRNLPSAINSQTSGIRQDIIRDIERHRQAVHSSSRILNNVVRHLASSLQMMTRKIENGLDSAQTYEFYRWMVKLVCIVFAGFVMLLILTAILCGCGKGKQLGKRTLQLSTMWLCLTSLILWGIISGMFLIAGHAEVYVCHALWDSPHYTTLSTLMDRPSPLLKNGQGILDSLLSDVDNVTLDISISDVLRDCEQDRPAYIVFQLDKLLDVNKETSYFEWEELQNDLGRLASSVDVGLLKTVSLYFGKLLTKMLKVSDVNLAVYRMDYNGPIVGKDLPSLVDQLENVAAQVSDLTTGGRLETLATRTQRLQITSVKPLEQLRADLVYKMTELELQLLPFRRKLNISLSHIHTAQYYIDNQGDVIAQKKISVYVGRLISHLAGWRTHVLSAATQRAAKCRPLFAVYAAHRTLLCSRYIASLHGWWVCGLLLGLLWCTTLTPLCVKLWRNYGRKIRAQEALILANLGSGAQETPTTARCEDSSNWNTPGPPPPRNDSW